MLLPEAAQRAQRPAGAVKAIIGGTAHGETGLFSERVHIRHSQRDSRLIECDDAFGNFETRLLLEWLIGDRQDDIRYNLARVLHSPEVQKNFDRVIIDAPPRMTAGLMNALCASTHLVVPFVLDILSAERVGLFLRTVSSMRGQLFPHLHLAGVVGTLKGDGTEKMRDTEQKAILEAKRGVADNWGPGDYVLENALIPRRQPVADTAGIGINLAVAALFDDLGEELFRRTTRNPPAQPGPRPAGARRAQGESAYEGQLAARRTPLL
jgi:chromosome partitioning protein